MSKTMVILAGAADSSKSRTLCALAKRHPANAKGLHHYQLHDKDVWLILTSPHGVSTATNLERGRHILAFSVTLVNDVVTVNKPVKSVRCVKWMACCPLRLVGYRRQADDRQKNLTAGDRRLDSGARRCVEEESI